MIPIEPIVEDPSVRQQGQTGCGACRGPDGLDFDFDYAFQAIVDVSSRSVYAYEALVRGPNGEPASSVLARVNDANRYRFDQACRVKAVKGAAALAIREFLSINFMPNAVYRPEACIRTTLEAARTYDFPIERIIFEVSESESVLDRGHLVEIFRAYKRLGFRTAIDDFGSGHSGLNLLADYQPHILKLDMGLVRGIHQDKVRQAIVRGVMQMAKEIGIQVLAEGIESPGERDFLRSAGITLMQGFLFCRPVFRGLGHIPDASWG